MSVEKKVAVLGAGSWGTAVANGLADNKVPNVLWGRDAKLMNTIQKEKRNVKYCPDFALNPALEADSELEKVLNRVDIVACAIPTQQIRSVLSPYSKILSTKWVVNTSKGIEEGTHLRISEIF